MDHDVLTPARPRGRRALLAALLLAGLVSGLLGAAPAEAAGCCTVTRSGSDLVITGTVPYRGAKYITSNIEHEDGWGIGGQRCAAKASGSNAYVKITIPVKYVPNGVYRVNTASANSEYTRYYNTGSSWFRVRNSPAVDLHVTAGPPKLHTSDTATFRYRAYGAVRRTQCQFDGQTWRGCDSPKTYSGLSEGRHVVSLRALGADGYASTATRRFRVDTLPPTPPKLTQERGFYVVEVTASGSRDPGSGIAAYEYQTFRDGSPTSPVVRDDWVRVYDAGTVVKFRAIDGIGRRSAWSVTEPITPTE